MQAKDGETEIERKTDRTEGCKAMGVDMHEASTPNTPWSIYHYVALRRSDHRVKREVLETTLAERPREGTAATRAARPEALACEWPFPLPFEPAWDTALAVPLAPAARLACALALPPAAMPAALPGPLAPAELA